MTSTTITSVPAVLAANAAADEWQALTLKSYAAVIADREAGHSDGDISKAWQTAKIRGASKTMIGYYARAHALTAGLSPSLVFAAIGEAYDGAVKAPHMVIMGAAKERKLPYVDAVLAVLADAVADADDDAERLTALGKAIADLKKKARTAQTPDGGEGGEGKGEGSGEGDGEGDEGDEGDEVVTDEATATSRLEATLKNLGRVVADWEREGDAPSAAIVDDFLTLAGRIARLQKGRETGRLSATG
jgi:hypothetical protein